VKTPEGIRHIHKTVNSGGSFGCNPLRQHVGLGAAVSVDVEILWPTTGKTQTFTNLTASRWYHIREDATQPKPLVTKAFPLGAAKTSQPPPEVVEE